jgi:large subunit ribosomal protein L10
MKKLGLLVKEISEKQVKDNLKSSGSFFVVKYSGVSSPDLSSLRQSLKGSRADLFVVKNAVARRALKECGLETMIKSIEGPCGLVFVKDEPVATSKVLYNFTKDHEQLKLEGGFLEDKVIDKKDIEALAKLPSKEVLRAQVVITLKSPISGFVMVLAQTLRKFVICLDQIRIKKGN